MSKFTAAEVLKNRDVMRDPMSGTEAKRYEMLRAFATLLAELERGEDNKVQVLPDGSAFAVGDLAPLGGHDFVEHAGH